MISGTPTTCESTSFLSNVFRCNWLGGEELSMAVEYSNSASFRSSLYKNLTLSTDSDIYGQVRQAGKFSFVRVYYSGHEVPYYQPAMAQELFQRAIFLKDVATGEEDTTSETGTTGGGTYESFPQSGMDPGPFLSWDGTRVVTAQSPTAVSATSLSLYKANGFITDGGTKTSGKSTLYTQTELLQRVALSDYCLLQYL